MKRYIFLSPIFTFIGYVTSFTGFTYLKKSSTKPFVSNTNLKLSGLEYIPAVLGSTALIFAVFNIDNKVDLTDAGKAATRMKRRTELKAKGEFPKPKDENMDPYRWGADEDEDIDLYPPKKSGGGCG